MAESVIELDLSGPWEPAEPPGGHPRSRRRLRWVAVCTVLAVALGVLVAAGVVPRTGPLYRVEQQVLGAVVAGDLLVVRRYRQSAADPLLEGRRLSDGKVLWTSPIDLQQYATASTGALILVQYSNADPGNSSTVTAVDTATGRQLWTRARASLIGTRDGRIIVEEMTEPAKTTRFVAGDEAEDPTINRAGDPQARHVLALDDRTGATVWDLTAPPGSVLNFTWDGRYPVGHITGVDQLDPSGLVTRRDAGTGAVIATRQLDWSGTPAVFSTGVAWLLAPRQAPGRAVVYPDGQRGGIVFDLTDGRPLFRTDPAAYDGLYQCATHLFCASGSTGTGIGAYDLTTGRPAWHVDRYSEVIAVAGDRLVVGTISADGGGSGPLGIADARTGAVTASLGDWRLIMGASANRILLWRPVDARTAILGELDPATGRITVFARASSWYGAPDCSADQETLACVMVGDLTVWRLPARH